MAETGNERFASMDEEKQREIASEGGKASSAISGIRQQAHLFGG